MRTPAALGDELSVPVTFVLLPLLVAEVMEGKFWSPFGPASSSNGSLGVTVPSGCPSRSSMPRPVFEKMELPRTAFDDPPATSTPSLPLLAIWLPSPSFWPPTVLLSPKM